MTRPCRNKILARTGLLAVRAGVFTDSQVVDVIVELALHIHGAATMRAVDWQDDVRLRGGRHARQYGASDSQERQLGAGGSLVGVFIYRRWRQEKERAKKEQETRPE